jgi:beta-lactamase regulating signal transducer with metallopeptidase domain
MTRAFLSFVLAFSASGLVLADSAIKSAVLLCVAGAVALVLRRDSAATRHLVWLTAIVALLVVPALSVVLPEWRVLPGWAAVDHGPDLVTNVVPAASLPPGVAWTDRSDPTDQTDLSEPAPHAQRPALPVPPGVTPPAIVVTLRQSLPSIWLAGCTLLLLRLLVARWLLRRSERGSVIVDCIGRLTPHRSPEGHTRLATALATACEQLGLRRSVTLLIHPHKTIPVVWGIVRHRLLLPEAAHNWSDEQLRSVLLHELAHIKRRDTLTQLLTQVACALHWFNPLVWVAAWRMHVERERACDDLVLVNGMQASTYAEHLLHIATKSPAARWTSACGLAMARSSSLEGRVLAVLNQRVRRHRVTTTMLAATALVAVMLAVPLAMLRAATDERKVDSETQAPLAATAAEPSEEPMPKHEYAQSLFRKWQVRARTDGKIPGALVGHLDRTIADFIKQDQNPDNATKLDAIRTRIDAKRDWTQAEVATLLDDIAAIATAPIGWADLPMEFDSFSLIKPGAPLPEDLKDAEWGQPAANGLRAAWLFEPRADQYAMGTVLKPRILFHNVGELPVVFKTETWHQSDSLTAVDANGKALPLNGTWYSGITPLAVYRLLPGEYCEVSAPGIAIGAGKYEDEHSTGAVGTILDVKVGDEVSLSHSVDAAQGITLTRPGDPDDPTESWKMQARDRVATEGPLPASKADREQLINRVMLDLFGVPATSGEVAAFVNDASPAALESLAARIAEKPPATPWTGKLPTGVTTFRVAEADPDAAKKPRAAFRPGRYVLSDNAHLLINQTTSGPDSRRTNKATIAFLSADPTIESRHQPHEIALPDGLNSYAFLWQRNSGEVLLMQRGSGTTINFTDPDNVTSTVSKVNLAPEWRALLPEGLLGIMATGAALQPAATQKPPVTLMLNADVEARYQWGETVNGLRMALVKPEAVGEKERSEIFDLRLVVQNVSEAATTINLGSVADGTPRLSLRESDRTLARFGLEKPVAAEVLLHPREAMILRLAPQPLDGQSITHDDPRMTFIAELEISPVDGEWSGHLTSADTSNLATANGLMPVDDDARQLFQSWNSAARRDGSIPGALIGQLGDSVRTFIMNNPTRETTAQLETMLPRLDASDDWSGPDAVTLLDEIAVLQSTPIRMALDHESSTVMQRGKPLPPELADAPWGVPANSLQIFGRPVTGGLRAAYLLEPRGDAHPLNTPLNGRILIHNSGTDTVVFRTRGWHQLDQTAKHADGSEVPVESTLWLTRGLLRAYRLAPGEYVELSTPGIGIGANSNADVWKNSGVGSWLDVQPGDVITLIPGDVPLSDWNEDTTQTTWWLDQIKSRLARHMPFPADPEARKLVLYRVAMELFGNPVHAQVNEAFVADDALDAIAAVLAQPNDVVPFSVTPFAGTLTPGTMMLTVVPNELQ